MVEVKVYRWMYMHMYTRIFKIIEFHYSTTHLPYTFASQSIEYHRLRQARGEGHDTHQTKRVE